MSIYLHQQFPIVGRVSPYAGDDEAVSSGWIDAGLYQRLIFCIQVGAMSAAVVAKVEEADNSSGDNPLDISGKTSSFTVSANKERLINLAGHEITEGKSHVRLTLTIANGDPSGTYVSGLVFGEPKAGPPTQLASVAAIVE